MAHLLSLGTQSKDAAWTLKSAPAGGSASRQWKHMPGTERGIAASSIALPCGTERLTLMSVLTRRCTRLAVCICQRDMLLLYLPCGVNNRSCRKLKPQTSTSATNINHIWRDQNDPPHYRFSVWWMETSAGQSIPNLSPHCPDLRYRSTQVTLSEARHFNHSEHQLQRLVYVWASWQVLPVAMCLCACVSISISLSQATAKIAVVIFSLKQMERKKLSGSFSSGGILLCGGIMLCESLHER